ncbi:potassium transporter TrkG [uncultured Duncaniella sp.]|uniref:potassium transporter TrkG n=1 Tax=uncultured Duncaniella sp. TaxID=2768039 RepID=UPI00345D81B4
MMHPSTVTTVTINGKGTSSAVVQKTLAFLFLYGMVICVGGLVLSLIGLPLSDAFFCSLSAISNTCLGTEISGLSENYAMIPDAAKWLLSLIMLIGRLEVFTILLLFTPTFWRK